MNLITKYTYFLEKRNLEERESVSVSHRIVDFLNKFNYEYEGVREDSEIFVSFKTGDFETIIPSRSLGGSQYTSPQGLYCFDMNVFKQRLFGDDEISFDSFSALNLSRSNNIIVDLGLGYANNGNSVGRENLWNGIPRYLYFVKVKNGSLILSSNSNALKFMDPMEKLLKLYSHNFLKDNESKVFDPKDKRGEELKNKSWNELKEYFTENSDKYKTGFTGSSDMKYRDNPLVDLMKSIDKDVNNLHVKFYSFLLSCCDLINNDNPYVRFNLLCKSIGVDGFTQRKGENSFIHPSPTYQTLLLTESCVEELMKIDLNTELKNDKYVTGEKNKKTWDSFVDSLKTGDVLYNKGLSRFERFIDSKSFIFWDSDNYKHGGKPNPLNYVKLDLGKSKIWNFIKQLKSEDFIKITTDEKTGGNSVTKKVLVIKFSNVEVSDNKVTFDTQTFSLYEVIDNKKYINFNINDQSYNKPFYYNLKTNDRESPLFDLEKINPPEYKYWKDNKDDLEKKGATWDKFIDKYEMDKIVNNIDDIFSKYKRESRDGGNIEDDMSLLTLLTDFSNEYADRVFYDLKSLNKQEMTLYLYRGNLDKPIKLTYSDNPQF